jgi:hypothetical protein
MPTSRSRGESFVALAEGVQNALWALGSVPKDHRIGLVEVAKCRRQAIVGEDLTQFSVPKIMLPKFDLIWFNVAGAGVVRGMLMRRCRCTRRGERQVVASDEIGWAASATLLASRR